MDSSLYFPTELPWSKFSRSIPRSVYSNLNQRSPGKKGFLKGVAMEVDSVGRWPCGGEDSKYENGGHMMSAWLWLSLLSKSGYTAKGNQHVFQLHKYPLRTCPRFCRVHPKLVLYGSWTIHRVQGNDHELLDSFFEKKLYR